MSSLILRSLKILPLRLDKSFSPRRLPLPWLLFFPRSKDEALAEGCVLSQEFGNCWTGQRGHSLNIPSGGNIGLFLILAPERFTLLRGGGCWNCSAAGGELNLICEIGLMFLPPNPETWMDHKTVLWGPGSRRRRTKAMCITDTTISLCCIKPLRGIYVITFISCKNKMRMGFYLWPVHAAAFSLPPFWGTPEARWRHISWSPVTGVRSQSIQAQGLHRDRADLLKICRPGVKPLTYISVGELDAMALLLPNNILVFPWRGGFWL